MSGAAPDSMSGPKRSPATGARTDPGLEDAVRLAAQVCQMPRAVVNLVSTNHQFQVAALGFAPDVCSREDSMCAVVVDAAEPVHVEDARTDPRFADNPFVDGRLARVRAYGSSPLTMPDGQVLGTLCVFDEEPRALGPEQRDALDVLARRVVDVLRLRRRTRELRTSLAELAAARDELTRSNTELAAFAGQVAHDLRSPLTSIALAVELAQEELLRAEGQTDPPARPVGADRAAGADLLDRAAGGVRRMDRLLADLLDYARVDGRVRRTDVDLAALVAEVREDLGEALRDVALETGPLPVVCADPTLLRMLLQNLLSNAAKFRRPGATPAVRISARATVRGWLVEVADDGPGVPTAEREHVLEPLTRLRTDVPGTGLGLATCRRIARAHGGRIVLDEAPGGGTLVRVELPSVEERPVSRR